ncbi:MAG: nucleoside triphosphate pyrophosphohydrolase [Spirochaetota bacterium]
MNVHDAFTRLYQIIVRLRAPDGCPWDREQTPHTMRRNLLEETYECIEAIESGSPPDVCEELGDVFMLVTMLARMYEEQDEFSVADVLAGVSDKLIRRHPHVFAGANVSSTHDVVTQWERIKVEQEGKPHATGLLDSVSRALPALERAHKLQRKAAKVGFDWPTLDGVRRKLIEEIEEVLHEAGGDAALQSGRSADDSATPELESEIGDMLFSAVNLARYLGVDPSTALNRANAKFVRRFRHMETEMSAQGRALSADELDAMDELWNAAKETEVDR